MKLRLIVLAALVAVASFAADVTGKWTAETQGPNGPRTQNMEFKVEGGKLTGSMAGRQGDTPISEGKIDGDKISFKVVREMNGNTMTMSYSGTVSGDEIKFTVDSGRGPAREITAKRAK